MGRTDGPVGELLPRGLLNSPEMAPPGQRGTGPEASPEVLRSQANQPADQANRPPREPDATGTSWGFIAGTRFNEDVTFWSEFVRVRRRLYE